MILYFTIVIPQINYHEIKLYGKYSIGTTTKKSTAAKGNDYIDYVYFFNGIKYSGYSNLNSKAIVPKGRYYVRFSYRNPEKSYIMFDKPVPISIKMAPLGGWEKLPLDSCIL